MESGSNNSKNISEPVKSEPTKIKSPRTFPQQNKFNMRGSQVKSLPHKVHKTGGRGQ
jgi:hypothetical protein